MIYFRDKAEAIGQGWSKIELPPHEQPVIYRGKKYYVASAEHRLSLCRRFSLTFFLMLLSLVTLGWIIFNHRVKRWAHEVGSGTAVSKIFFESLEGLYKGTLKFETPHGFGKTILENGDKYRGSFKQGQADGKGRMKYTNGDEYTGDWKNGVRQGSGTLKLQNGNELIGQWIHDVPRRTHQTLLFANGNRYVGQITRQAPHRPQGYGTLASGDGVYRGNFSLGQPHGQGVMHYFNGDEYKGSFIEGRAEGVGKMKRANGIEYKGQFVNNQPQGYCKITYPDGRKYTGNVEAWNRSGQGTCWYPNGTFYQGAWNLVRSQDRQIIGDQCVNPDRIKYADGKPHYDPPNWVL